jgi:hypothetical protein
VGVGAGAPTLTAARVPEGPPSRATAFHASLSSVPSVCRGAHGVPGLRIGRRRGDDGRLGGPVHRARDPQCSEGPLTEAGCGRARPASSPDARADRTARDEAAANGRSRPAAGASSATGGSARADLDSESPLELRLRVRNHRANAQERPGPLSRHPAPRPARDRRLGRTSDHVRRTFPAPRSTSPWRPNRGHDAVRAILLQSRGLEDRSTGHHRGASPRQARPARADDLPPALQRQEAPRGDGPPRGSQTARQRRQLIQRPPAQSAPRQFQPQTHPKEDPKAHPKAHPKAGPPLEARPVAPQACPPSPAGSFAPNAEAPIAQRSSASPRRRAVSKRA